MSSTAHLAVAHLSMARRESSLTQNNAWPPLPAALATNAPLHVDSPMDSCRSFMMP